MFEYVVRLLFNSVFKRSYKKDRDSLVHSNLLSSLFKYELSSCKIDLKIILNNHLVSNSTQYSSSSISRDGQRFWIFMFELTRKGDKIHCSLLSQDDEKVVSCVTTAQN